ncbi:hypothetical protein ACWEU6_37090 [Streptosporangium sandarakinum]|uniref:hypothetical protein n=1 Tax=Streptosporangium sandarakinum TaxID=1260955 RepID=UPI003674A39A
MARRRIEAAPASAPTYPEVPDRLRRCIVEDWLSEDYELPPHVARQGMSRGELVDQLVAHAWNAWRDAARAWCSEHQVPREDRLKVIPVRRPAFRNRQEFEARMAGRFSEAIRRGPRR